MQLYYFQDFIFVRSRIIREDIDSLLSSLYKRDDCGRFMLSLYVLLNDDPFILLNKNLIYKVYNLINQLSFRFSSDNTIRNYRRLIVEKLIERKSVCNIDLEKNVLEIIEREKQDRCIPDEIILTKDDVLKMYSFDFENYAAICNFGEYKASFHIFYFLSTVQKMYTEYPDIFLKGTWKASIYSIFEKIDNVDDEIVGQYLEDTKMRIDGKINDSDKILSKKIILFPNEK